jgi:phage-related protein
MESQKKKSNIQSKPVEFLSNTLNVIKQFPEKIIQDIGYKINLLQLGEILTDFKPMPTIGDGVSEIRFWHSSGTYRVIYAVKFKDFVYILHAFKKSSKKTKQADIDLARKRYKKLLNNTLL